MKITVQHNLRNHHTFKINLYCDKFIEIEHDDNLDFLWENNIFETSFFILGGGSNVLFTKNYNGTIIHLNSKGIKIISETDKSIFIEVAAGEIWNDFVEFCIHHNYFGAENLVGIPGQVGSCPVQNIGSYGVEVKDIIHKVKGRSVETGEEKVLTREECNFEYRNSIFKNELKDKFLITSVVFKMSKEEQYHLSYNNLNSLIQANTQPLSLTTVKNTILEIRNKKLPNLQEIGCAGSFFKNPIISLSTFKNIQKQFPELVHFPVDEYTVKLAAGQLIELCGWKGYRKGDAGVYSHQALVLVNYGNATGEQLLALSNEISYSVYRHFGVRIEPEVKIL